MTIVVCRQPLTAVVRVWSQTGPYGISFFLATAPIGSWPPHSRGFYITHNDASQAVGPLWTSDQPVAETSTWQNTTITTDKYPCPWWDSNPQNLSRREAADLRLRPRGHWNRPYGIWLALRWLMSYIYGAPILDVSRSHTTTQHSR